MQIITIISQAMDIARKKFTRGEQQMLIDIYNGTMLMPHLLGQLLIGQAEDSFRLYPGVYEEKWGVDQKEMIDKIISLDPMSAALVELWAVAFWGTGEGQLEDYLAGKTNQAMRLQEAVEHLETAIEKMEQSKSAFQSATIAQARAEAEKTKEILEGMI